MWFSSNNSNDNIASQFWQKFGTISANNINLRDEFNALVLGRGSYPGIGIFMIHRILSRDGARCPCWNENRGSSSDCIYCKGESYSWTEVWARGYFTQTYGRSLVSPPIPNKLLPAGVFDLDKSLIYLPYNVEPQTGDSFFRIRLDLAGKPYYPIERVEKWRAVNVEDRRQESGELAFWLTLCERVEF